MSDTFQAYGQASYQRKAGRIQKQEAETAARQIELQEVQREADRKERLAQAMASTVANAGASGVAALEGSPLSVLKESVRQEEQSTQRDKYMTKLEAMTTRYRGRIAKAGAYAQSKATEKQGRSATFTKMFSMFSGGMGGGGSNQSAGQSTYTSSGGTGSNYSQYNSSNMNL